MQTISVTIAEESKDLNPSQLADFLYLFRGANVALRRIVPKADHDVAREPSGTELEDYRKRLGSFSPEDLDSFFDPTTAPEIVQISEISKHSPLEMGLIGCAFLLVLGVIFSGGKVEISEKRFKAQLPPFGKGLKSLRAALGLDKTLQAGFGIRGIIIKLNKDEYAALKLQDPKTKGRGGFQNFLVGLQNRVKNRTLELELSESDLERIFRWKANPGKGGWQSRFKKIFGRHFPDSHGPGEPKQLPPGKQE